MLILFEDMDLSSHGLWFSVEREHDGTYSAGTLCMTCEAEWRDLQYIHDGHCVWCGWDCAPCVKRQAAVIANSNRWSASHAN